ncbi:TPA: hypothetical protein L6B03_20880 [Pseudomonas aeruginosa]|nr:hypothetical protein [Pseudomonas aeruginosa]
MQGLAIFSAYIIEVHGDFECISIRGLMLTGSKRPFLLKKSEPSRLASKMLKKRPTEALLRKI